MSLRHPLLVISTQKAERTSAIEIEGKSHSATRQPSVRLHSSFQSRFHKDAKNDWESYFGVNPFLVRDLQDINSRISILGIPSYGSEGFLSNCQ